MNKAKCIELFTEISEAYCGEMQLNHACSQKEIENEAVDYNVRLAKFKEALEE